MDFAGAALGTLASAFALARPLAAFLGRAFSLLALFLLRLLDFEPLDAAPAVTTLPFMTVMSLVMEDFFERESNTQLESELSSNSGTSQVKSAGVARVRELRDWFRDHVIFGTWIW